MLKQFIDFIKYNNIAALVLLALLILGTSALAAEPVRQALGQKISKTQGFDNTLLLAADLDKMDMDFKIEKIEQDDKFYYVTYTYLDLTKAKQAWEYQLKEKTMKINRRRLKKDLGLYLAQELSEVRYERLKYLKKAQARAKQQGQQKRVVVEAYSGLLGKVLNTASKVFPGYKPIKTKVLPSPPNLAALRTIKAPRPAEQTIASSAPDNLTAVYLDYLKRKDPDKDNVFGLLDNCPQTYNPDQADSDGDGLGDACDPDNNSASSSPPAGETASSTASTSAETVISTSTPPAEAATSSQPSADDSNPAAGSASSSEPIIVSPGATSSEPEVQIINPGSFANLTASTATSS